MTYTSSLFLVVATGPLILLVILTSSFETVEGENKILNNFGSNLPLTMIPLGSADGKSYFAEPDQRMNWTEAGAYCQTYNLTLASVQTNNQLDLLNSTLIELGYRFKLLWTSGRESRQPSMIVWNETESQPDTTLHADWWFRGEGYFYCVYFFPDLTKLYANNCELKLATLCQSDVV